MCTNEMRFCQHKRWFNQHMDSPCHRDWLYPKRKLDYLELKLTNESWDLGLLRICSIYHQSMAKKIDLKKVPREDPTLWHLWPETVEFLSSTPSDGRCWAALHRQPLMTWCSHFSSLTTEHHHPSRQPPRWRWPLRKPAASSGFPLHWNREVNHRNCCFLLLSWTLDGRSWDVFN